MTLSQLNQFPTDKIPQDTIPFSFLMLELVDFLFLPLIFNWVRRIFELLSSHQPSLQSQLALFDDSEVQTPKKSQDFESSNLPRCFSGNIECFCREEVEMVMGKLGICCHLEGEKIQEKLGPDDLSNLFEEKEPSLEEVKEAFDVFDENGDGFIDERELQRILCALGLKEGLAVENCRMMIRVFDENGDDKIDFNEFVKIMENSFC
ncbi:unnamed protein product [Ilex paraguariensis]|uniref:EF-hand domain-containing protein n=1 Tax=Ilex paraguariensis TaxID=185542 RepID=A0ABC8T0V8_9AQUA